MEQSAGSSWRLLTARVQDTHASLSSPAARLFSAAFSLQRSPSADTKSNNSPGHFQEKAEKERSYGRQTTDER